jgi:hypothetical protein
MFAPDHQRVADELLRVCRRGGVIGMINFTPEGAGGDFFRVLAPYLPPLPTNALPPLLWGTEDHVRTLFGDRVVSLELRRHEYVEEAASAGEYHELFRHCFGPMVAIYASLADRPQMATLDQAFLEFVGRWNRATSAGRVAIPYECLLVLARPAAAA